MATKKKTTTTTKTPKKAVAKKAAETCSSCSCSERMAEIEAQVTTAIRRINILKDASRMPSSSRDNW